MAGGNLKDGLSVLRHESFEGTSSTADQTTDVFADRPT